MGSREKLIALVKRAIIDWEYGDASEKIADHLISNGVVVREKGEWILHMDGSSTCKKCRTNTKYSWDFDNSFNFCPHCGSDMRAEEQNRSREVENDG